MRTVELFCGTKSFSKVAEKLGHETFTVDNNSEFKPDLTKDIRMIAPVELGVDTTDILWASPPCQSFSVGSIGKHWNKDHTPKTIDAEIGLQILDQTIRLIAFTRPKKWYIENPRGKMRKVIDDIFTKHGIDMYRQVTITYCQYGDTRMKPTDIWTNDYNWIPRPICKNGDSCHESAPRGSKTGTQGLKGAKERGVIPEELFYEIFDTLKKVQK